MLIKHIEIENFKAFKNISLDFDSQFTLIIGNNGTGKTTVLEALSVSLGAFLSGFDGVQPRNIYVDDIRRDYEKLGDATVIREYQVPVKIKSTGDVNGKRIEWERSRSLVRNGRTLRHGAKDLINYATGLQKALREKRHDVILPMLSFQGAGRLFSQKKNKWYNPFGKDEPSRLVGYTDCLEAEANIKLFASWLKKMTSIQLQKNKQIGELTAVRKAIENFMSVMLEEELATNIYFDFEESEVIIETSAQSIPLRKMSAGYRSVIGMVADIAYRMSVLNPQLKEEAVNLTPGIVLIDELDLHLHPEWQWRIVEGMKKTFPLVQFVATTHAPIIISTCEGGEIIDLHKTEGKIVKEKAPYGWQIEDVLSDKMNTYTRAPMISSKIEELELLLSKSIRGIATQAENDKIKDLTKKLYTLLPEGDPAVTLSKLSVIGKLALEGESND